MKKLASTLLILILCLGMLAGCGGSQTPDAPVAENDAPVSTPETPAESETPTEPETPAEPEPSEEPAPAPSEEPETPAESEDPIAPAPSEEPEPSEEPAPAPSEEPSVDDSLYGSLTIYDVHNETTFTFDKAYLEDDWYLHVKAGSNYTAKKDSGDPAWIYAEYASYLDFAGCWMAGIDVEMGPQCWADTPGGCVDEIFQKLTAEFGENCEEGQLVLPLIQYEWEGYYLMFLDK